MHEVMIMAIKLIFFGIACMLVYFTNIPLVYILIGFGFAQSLEIKNK